jgi:parallel beta-helix repeat protein
MMRAALLGSTALAIATSAAWAQSVVNVPLGGSIQAAINSAPAGSTIQLSAGTYGFQQFEPQSGDTIIGAPGGTTINGGGSAASMVTNNGATNVVIANLTTTNFNNPAQIAPIMTGNSWTVSGVTSTGNGGAGLYVGGANNIIQGGSYTNNGQIGIDGSSANGSTITGVTVTGNNTSNVNQQWDAGGIKITSTNGLTITGITVSSNNGNGIWGDIGDSNATVTNNTVNGNSGEGIIYEISHSASITGNSVAGNTGGGIYISNSDGVTASGNSVSVPANSTIQGDGSDGGIVVFNNTGRGSDPSGTPYLAINDTVTGNTIAEASASSSGVLAASGQPTTGDTFIGNTIVAAGTAIATPAAMSAQPAVVASPALTAPTTQLATSAAPAASPTKSNSTVLGTYVGTVDDTNAAATVVVQQQYQQFVGAMGQPAGAIDTYIGNSTPESQWVTTAQWAASSLRSFPWCAGMMPVIGLPMASTGENADQSFRNIISGSEDSIFNGIFQAWVTAGYTGFYIRPGFEFNGTWDPWSVSSSNAADFVAAFQHIAGLAHAFKGALIGVIWNPNVGATPMPMAQLYPGNTAVDVIGLDTYGAPVNTSASPSDASTSTSDFTLLDALAMAKANNKAFALPETGGTDSTFPAALASTIAGSGVPVVLMSIWDANGSDGNLAWSGDPTVSAAWKQGYQTIANSSSAASAGLVVSPAQAATGPGATKAASATTTVAATASQPAPSTVLTTSPSSATPEAVTDQRALDESAAQIQSADTAMAATLAAQSASPVMDQIAQANARLKAAQAAAPISGGQ